MLLVLLHLVNRLLASAGWARYSQLINVRRRTMIVTGPVVVVLGASDTAANGEETTGEQRQQKSLSQHKHFPRRLDCRSVARSVSPRQMHHGKSYLNQEESIHVYRRSGRMRARKLLWLMIAVALLSLMQLADATRTRAASADANVSIAVSHL